MHSSEDLLAVGAEHADPPATDALGIALSEQMDRMMRFLLREIRIPDMPSRTGMSVLGSLRDRGPCRITELAATERITQPSMTNLVNRLEDEGLVQRQADPHDGRAVQVVITDAGRALQRHVRHVRAVELTRRLAALDEGERATLASALALFDKLLDPPR